MFNILDTKRGTNVDRAHRTPTYIPAVPVNPKDASLADPNKNAKTDQTIEFVDEDFGLSMSR